MNAQILTLHFMPWCRIDRECSVGHIALIPFSRENPSLYLGDEAARAVNTILADFIGVDGNPVTRCVLVSLAGRVLVEGLGTRAAFDAIHDHIQIACLSSLDGREYIGRAEPYSNSGCFALYTRQYRDGSAVAPPIFRRDNTPMGLVGSALRVHMPVQTGAIARVVLNDALYRGLVELRHQMLERERVDDWAAWAESIYSFNLANTDDESISDHVEWVLMSSAIERLLEARPSAIDVAKRFVSALAPNNSSHDAASELMRQWAKEFYRQRNDFAHGKITGHQPRTWNSACHLLLGAVAFPLLVKRLLEREGLYSLTDMDRREPGAFVRFAADLRSPTAQLASWHQYVRSQTSG
ncbi:MAG: hypothetical protein ACLQAT_17325 [Candidatus Binataceae bacterium]